MRKIIVILIIIFLVTILIVAIKIFGPTVSQPEGEYLYVNTGTTYQELKKELIDKDIISGTFFFEKIATQAGLDKDVKPGKYKIADHSSIIVLVRQLNNGKQDPVKFVITKLRTREDLAKRIAKYFEIDSATAATYINSDDSLAKYSLDTNRLMTIVIPNTYNMRWTDDIRSIVERLKKEKDDFWTKARKDKAEKQTLTPVEVYIMASIIEEETNKQKDKLLIASTYINRLNKGIKLEADPTVKFAMRDFGLKRILYKHLNYYSPYNTYRNLGLPPGPICSPAISTIDAVLDAPVTDYLFFVAKPDFNGYSNFATNYEQHKIYAKQYQLALDSLIIRKRQKADSSK